MHDFDESRVLLGEFKGDSYLYGPGVLRQKDLFRIVEELKGIAPDVLVSFGGGSTIDAVMVDEYMRPILEAARDGDLATIRNV